MPLIFSNIKPGWDAAIAIVAPAPVMPQGQVTAYGLASDAGKELVHLPFTFDGEDYHLTIYLEALGEANNFHVTPERTKPKHLIDAGKAGTTYTNKNFPSVYFDFRIAGPAAHQIAIEQATQVRFADEDKPKKVFSAQYKPELIRAARDIMTAFIVYMMGRGTEFATVDR